MTAADDRAPVPNTAPPARELWAADHFTPAERVEFDACTAAGLAVMKWIDADPSRYLVGCTPSMVSQLAVDAYRRAQATEGSRQADLITAAVDQLVVFRSQLGEGDRRRELDDLIPQLRSAAAGLRGVS